MKDKNKINLLQIDKVLKINENKGYIIKYSKNKNRMHIYKKILTITDIGGVVPFVNIDNYKIKKFCKEIIINQHRGKQKGEIKLKSEDSIIEIINELLNEIECEKI